MVVSTAEKNGIVIRARKSGATFERRTCSTYGPLDLADVTSSRNDEAGDWSSLFFARVNARAKFAAFTGWPLLNRKPRLSRIV